MINTIDLKFIMKNTIDLKLIIKNLIYLNIDELKIICGKLNISYNIYIEKNDKIIKTNEIDHKIIIINNIKKSLKNTKTIHIDNQLLSSPTYKTLYKKNIINFDKLDNINENTYIYYGQYYTTNKDILKLMKELTNDKFKFGAISQKIIRTIWKKNKLITYKEFANLWINENNKQKLGINYPELAYNQFMKKVGDRNKWFDMRNEIIIVFKKYKLL